MKQQSQQSQQPQQCKRKRKKVFYLNLLDNRYNCLMYINRIVSCAVYMDQKSSSILAAGASAIARVIHQISASEINKNHVLNTRAPYNMHDGEVLTCALTICNIRIVFPVAFRFHYVSNNNNNNNNNNIHDYTTLAELRLEPKVLNTFIDAFINQWSCDEMLDMKTNMDIDTDELTLQQSEECQIAKLKVMRKLIECVNRPLSGAASDIEKQSYEVRRLCVEHLSLNNLMKQAASIQNTFVGWNSQKSQESQESQKSQKSQKSVTN
jgi:hypothetical protein